MKLGIIAGNRLLPIILAKNIKENSLASQTIAFCFKGETSSCISKYVDRAHWIDIGKLGVLREELRKEGIKDCIMVGQITPLRIFRRKNSNSCRNQQHKLLCSTQRKRFENKI